MTTVTPPHIEIREWGRPARRLVLRRPIVVGRDRADETVADDEVSRQHLRLVPSPTALSVVDLGSRNGTTVNGMALTGRAALGPGDVVRIGRSEIVVLHPPTQQHEPVELEHDSTYLAHRMVQAPPPPPPPPPSDPSPLRRLAERVLGIDPTGERQLFPPSSDLTSRVPETVWRAARLASISAYVALVVTMFVRPTTGLFLFFHVVVPVLPIVFLIAPGLWRNICPLAATNQVPRTLHFSRGLSAPEWLRNRGYLIAVVLFFGIAGARLAGLDRNGAAMGVVLAGAVTAAFIGGVVFKGKSGWCSSICPLFPLQRAYGQTPFVTVPNSHCQPCVGCAKNCYDFKPRAAYQADLADDDPAWSASRKLFAAALPGFVLGFFFLAGLTAAPTVHKYMLLALFMLVFVGLFFVLDAITAVSAPTLAACYAALALNIFYWFTGPMFADALARFAVDMPGLRWMISGAVAVLTAVWVARTRVSELQFAWTTGKRVEPVLLNTPRVRPPEPPKSAAEVCFEADGATVPAEIGMSLLDAAEKAGQQIEAGCRMGVCGADPVAVVDGMSCLSAPEQDELNTLQRLGLGKGARMACCARIRGGPVTVALNPEPGDTSCATTSQYDRSIVSVVVIGNGIAGVTAADFIRRGHPDCEIHVVGQESLPLYNRMGISRLMYGRSAMQGLFLLPERWYDEHGITAWLNTVARRIDIREQHVLLGTGETLPYDRLILAMGAGAAAPRVSGLDRPGTFVLRQARDAMLIRAYAQENKCRRAVVAGGGLLGLEAAWSLHLLGLDVVVLERGPRILARQIDPRCSELVTEHFAKAGIQIIRNAEAHSIIGAPQVTGTVLRDGRTLPCDLFLTAVGIRPNIDLARRAGIPVGRGVLVDDRMRTRVPSVFAAGDVAEHAGMVHGLWPVAANQAQTAAVNALGGDMVITPESPATMLKGVDLELFSAGQIRPGPHDEVVVCDRPHVPSYRRLVVSQGRVVGATILGHHPRDLAAAQKAVKASIAIDNATLDSLGRGDWTVL